jgi:hypothetical protein
LFGWRRQARLPAAAVTDTEVPKFVPAVVEAQLPVLRALKAGT